MSNELKHFGVLGMKWGKHKAKQPQGKPLGPVKIYGTASNGIQFFHDTPGIIVSSNVRLSKRHINSINKQRAKGVSTMDALAKMGALGTVDRDYRQPLTPKQVRQAAERYAKASAKSGHVRRMGLTSAVIGIAAVKTALEAGATTDDPKTAAAVLVGSSAVASVLAYAGSRAIQSRRRKKNLESVRNNFGNVEAPMTNELYHHGVLGMRWGIKRSPKNNHSSDNRRSTTSASKKSVSSLEDTHKRLLERSKDPRYGPKVHNAYQQILMNYSNRMRILEEASDHFKRKGDTKTYLEVQNRIRDTNKELIKTMYEVDQIADQVSARYGIK